MPYSKDGVVLGAAGDQQDSVVVVRKNIIVVKQPPSPGDCAYKKTQKYETRGEARQSARLLSGLGKVPSGT